MKRHTLTLIALLALGLTASSARAPVNAENNLRRLFGELFGLPDVMARLQYRSSILDIVGDEARGLSRQLSRNDRKRFDDYLQSVRDIESRLAT